VIGPPLSGSGNVPSDLMFVGEAPGWMEIRERRVFVGRAGQVLNRVFREVGIDRKEVYITNVVKCRTVDERGRNRTPDPQEVLNCMTSWLYGEVEKVNPLVICTLGATASRAFTGSAKRSRIGNIPYVGIGGWLGPVYKTWHPAAMLYSPHLVESFINDLKLVKELVDKRKERRER